MKLHICCGGVYLTGYINCDIQGYLRDSEEAKQITSRETTLERYYLNTLPSMPVPKRGRFVIDQRVDILRPWPWATASSDRIVMIQALEHFLPQEVEFIISEVHRVLKPGAEFLFDFPDLIETIRSTTDFRKLVRLVYCNHLDQYSIHRTAYNQEIFQKALEDGRAWSKIVFREIVKHDYPTIGGIAVK